MHAGRTKAPEAQAPKAAALLDRWRRSKTFYASPFGSNDDWCASCLWRTSALLQSCLTIVCSRVCCLHSAVCTQL